MSRPIDIQPGGTVHLDNAFVPQAGETVRTVYECQEGCSDTCGRRTTVALTNIRLISRIQDPCFPCCCCTQGPHYDKTIFLHDIGVLQEAGGATAGTCLACLSTCQSGGCVFFLCGKCCGDHPKVLGIKGGYGSEDVAFSTRQYGQAVNEVTSMLVQMKSR